MTHRKTLLFIAVYALWVFLIINVGNVKVDYLWCIDLPAWQLTSHNKSNDLLGSDNIWQTCAGLTHSPGGYSYRYITLDRSIFCSWTWNCWPRQKNRKLWDLLIWKINQVIGSCIEWDKHAENNESNVLYVLRVTWC